MSERKNLTNLLLFIVTPELTGVLSALLSGGFSDFYAQMKEPPLLPPSWLFPVVWTVLYALMGISAYLVYSSDKDSGCLKIYAAQLAVNFIWTIIFFRFRALWLSFAVIILLWILILAMIRCFCKVRKSAAFLNIPYLLWVTFAAYLTLSIAVLNS